MNCKDAATWMDAYIDNELELSRQLEIEHHLKSCRGCGAVLERRRALQASMRAAPLRFSAPVGLQERVREKLRQPVTVESSSPSRDWFPIWKGWWGGFASAAALTSALFLTTPYLAGPFRDDRLVEEVTNSHVHSLMAHHLTDVETSNQHVVKPWFNGRIDFSPEVRDLSDHGFPLAGGRLDYIRRQPVAALVYHRALHPINLFIWPSDSAIGPQAKHFTRQGYHLIHWTQGGMTFWVISDLNDRELNDFAELLQMGPK